MVIHHKGRKEPRQAQKSQPGNQANTVPTGKDIQRRHPKEGAQQGKPHESLQLCPTSTEDICFILILETNVTVLMNNSK